MRAFLLDAVAVSAVAGSAVLLVVLLRPLLRRRYTARLRCAVWWALALWLCVPLKFTLPQAPVHVAVPQAVAQRAAVLPSVEQRQPHAASQGTPAVSGLPSQGASGALEHSAKAALPTPAPAEKQTARPDTAGLAAAPTPAQTETPPAPVRQTRLLSLWQLAAFAWAAVAAALLTVRLGAYAVWRRRIMRWSCPVRKKALLALAQKAACAAGVRRPAPLYCTPQAACPMALGLLRPVLLLPEGLPADNGTAMMLIHEYTHLARRDIALKALLVLATSLHWFNPAVWLLARAAGEDIELACDETALRGKPAPWRDAYGRALVAGAAAPQALLATHFSAGKKHMMQRLTAMFDKRCKKKGVLAFTALLLTVALAAGMVACRVDGLPFAEEKENEPMPENAVPIRTEDAQALEEPLWNGLIVLAPVTGEVPQSDLPDLIALQLGPDDDLAVSGGTERLFFDEAGQVGLAVEAGTFADMPHVKRTTDGGRTWRLADTSQAAAASPRGDYRDAVLFSYGGDAVVLEYATGTMANGGTYIYYLMSTDRGETWYCPRLPKPMRQAIHALYRSGLCSNHNKSPIYADRYMEDQTNPRFVKNEDGTLRETRESYYQTEAGGPVYAIAPGSAVHTQEDGQETVTQTLGDYFGREIRLVYRGFSQVEIQSGDFVDAGGALGRAGNTPYGPGIVAELWVGGEALSAGYLYHDPWSGGENVFQSPPLVPLPEEMQQLKQRAASADPGGQAVELAYNFGLALLKNDQARAAELMMGRDAVSAVFNSGARDPFAELAGFVCTGAAVSVDETRPGAPAALTLDIESPGKTGLPRGRHTYCLEYRMPDQAYPAGGGPAGGTVKALVPLAQWQPQGTKAQQAAQQLRGWGTAPGFENGGQLVQESPAAVMLYLMVTGGKDGYTGKELEALAEQLLDITAMELPQTDRFQNEEYWFIAAYDAAADTYTLLDGFDDGMEDVGTAARWMEEPQADGTLRLTRQTYRDGLCLTPWTSMTYTMRENEDGSWRILSAAEEPYHQIIPYEDALLSSYQQGKTPSAPSAKARAGFSLEGQGIESDLDARQGRVVLQNARCELNMDAGSVQFLPEENTMEITWRPADDVTGVSVYENGSLVCRADNETGRAAVREGGYTQDMCENLLYQARSAVRSEYQRQSIPAPGQITPAKADKPGDALSDAEVEEIVRTVCRGVSRLCGWEQFWLMDTAAPPIVWEYSSMGNGQQYLYWPCLEFASYDAYQAVVDSVLLHTEMDESLPAVLEWEGKAYLPDGVYGLGGPLEIVPKTVEVTHREADRLDVVIGEQLYEESIPLRKTPHTLTVQNGCWVLDSFSGDAENSNAAEVDEAWRRYWEVQGAVMMYDQDFMIFWSAMGLDTLDRCWALADDGAWAASGRERLNFVQDEQEPSKRWLKVESPQGTALYRLQEGGKNSDGSSRLVFLSKEQDGQTIWYEKGQRPVLTVDVGASGDNLVEMEWTQEGRETGLRQSYFYYQPQEYARKEQRTPA